MSSMGPPNKPPYPINHWNQYQSDPGDAYARGIAVGRAEVIEKLKALYVESLTLPLPSDYIDGIECALEHISDNDISDNDMGTASSPDRATLIVFDGQEGSALALLARSPHSSTLEAIKSQLSADGLEVAKVMLGASSLDPRITATATYFTDWANRYSSKKARP